MSIKNSLNPISKSSFFLWRVTLLIALQLTLLFLGNKAQAGGGDIDPSFPVDPQAENRPKIIDATANFKWDKWSQPYWLNAQVCRDKGGDTACFNADTAKKFGWNIPTRN
ncbi:hypothetical protein BCD67_07660 [Oscillatoriales cyanobacterium USR001]|nr:hypothetical protein BCD67_07660 [Oscillatoriales cyanobacterium USR001]